MVVIIVIWFDRIEIKTFFDGQVLAIFKQLHATRQRLFRGDEPNLAKARAKINEEFRKYKDVEKTEIPELIGVAKEVELFYRTRVVQAVPVEDGTRHSTF